MGTGITVNVAGGIGRLVLDNPPVNVFTIPVMEAAVAGLRQLEADPGVKVIAVEAAGDRAFSAGVDVADHTPDKMRYMLDIFDELCMGLHRSPKPTVALVRRMALGGGCEVVACCDMVLASDQATFGQPEIKVGVFPIIGVALFPDLLGAKAAAELLLSGATYSAADALRVGLVSRVAADDEFQEQADKYLGRLAKNSGLVMSLTKKAMLAGLGKGVDEALKAADAVYVDELMITHDANEGLQAFLERRPPEWKEA
ncbi:MAG: enoyl-CoA hydratase/isomerase family protein [Thermoleophilia bacterium]